MKNITSSLEKSLLDTLPLSIDRLGRSNGLAYNEMPTVRTVLPPFIRRVPGPANCTSYLLISNYAYLTSTGPCASTCASAFSRHFRVPGRLAGRKCLNNFYPGHLDMLSDNDTSCRQGASERIRINQSNGLDN